MDHSEIKLHTNRIISGKIYYDGQAFSLPSIDYEAEQLYSDYFTEAVYSGVLTNDELYHLSPGSKEDIDVAIEKKSKEIKDAKLDLFRNRNSNEVHFFRNKLGQLDSELDEILKAKNIFYQYSAEYVASYIRDLSLLFKCNRNPIKAHAAYLRHQINEGLIRSVARSSYFFELFNTGGLRYFPKLMTDEQKSLVGWFKKYKNIYSHHEKPEDWVIEDDDMLDGWLISIQKEDKKPEIPVKGQEVFIFAKPQRTWDEHKKMWVPGVSDIYDQNGIEGKVIIKGRQNKIKKENSINQFDLPDVKKDFAGMIVRGE